MPHPIVDQLRFARSEFARSLAGVAEEEGLRRFGSINSLGWMVGHLAAQEQRYWLAWAQRPPLNGRPHDETLGTMIRRVTYHSWFHNGEAQAVRQLLGHTDLPTFVGDFQDEAPCLPEAVSLAR